MSASLLHEMPFCSHSKPLQPRNQEYLEKLRRKPTQEVAAPNVSSSAEMMPVADPAQPDSDTDMGEEEHLDAEDFEVTMTDDETPELHGRSHMPEGYRPGG